MEADFFGRPFEPRKGTGTGDGVRWDRADDRLSGTVNFFRVRHRDTGYGDPRTVTGQITFDF